MLKRTFLLVWISLGAFAAEYTVIPHIAADTGSFTSRLVLENRGELDLSFGLLAYKGDQVAGSKVVTLTAGKRQAYNIETLFEQTGISHLFVSKHPSIYAGIEYIPTNNPDNRTYVEGIRHFSQRWRIYPSNWQMTFDGLVLVGPTCGATDVSIIQYDASGNYLANVPMEGGALFGFGKMVFNLAQVFEPADASYVEIYASHPIAAMGLKGSLAAMDGFDFLVGNQAEAYPAFETLIEEVTANRALWERSALAANHSYVLATSCFCPPMRHGRITVTDGQLSALQYEDDHSDVELAQVHAYKTIEALFALIDNAIAQNADHIEVQWNRDSGYPEQITIDWSRCTSDDELYYSVQNMGEPSL